MFFNSPPQSGFFAGYNHGFTGNVNVMATQTQNMDDEYRGWLGAQSIAGSVAGSGGASVAGAFAIIVSSADTLAKIGKGAELTAEDVVVLATDKSKLALRAGGVSISTGATVGLGGSFAMIYTYNTVKALIDQGITVLQEYNIC